MKLLKQLHEMTELEAFECLQGAASAIIKGDDLPDEVRQWVGRGLLAMCRGENFNNSFAVKNKKKQSPNLHAKRYAMVQYLRKYGVTKDAAIAQVAEKMAISEDTINDSLAIQRKIQAAHKKKMQGGGN